MCNKSVELVCGDSKDVIWTNYDNSLYNLENEMAIKAGELARGDNNEEIYTNLNRLQQFTFFITWKNKQFLNSYHLSKGSNIHNFFLLRKTNS